MCGIIGYKGVDDGRNTVLRGLKRLEYRGYDSWGIAGISEKLWSYKQTGSVNLTQIGTPSNILIGHTRWATHGGVCEKNAHPHVSNDQSVAIVHNGIIDNYEKLKSDLTSYTFVSETDSEIIANLIQKYLPEGFPFALHKTLTLLEGTYAIAAIHDNSLGFGRNSSPLLLGIADTAVYVASDPAPFPKHVRGIIYLDEGEWGYVDRELHIFSKDGTPIIKQAHPFHHEHCDANKNGYMHYMHKEIYEQPQTLNRAQEQPYLERAKELIDQSDEVFLIGCGTSYHACMAASAFLSKHTRATPVLASEYHYILPYVSDKHVAIIVSQSGETADSIELAKELKKRHCKILGIINAPGSTLWRMADIVLPMNCGIEIGVASTKAYTAALTILAALAGQKLSLGALCAHYLPAWHTHAKQLAKQMKRDVFLIGKQEAYAYALEGALKIKEIAYLRAEGLAGGELKHGTLALIEQATPIFAISTLQTRQELLNNAHEIKARGGRIIGIDSSNNRIYDEYIECTDPILSIVPLQLLALELAILHGYDPDKPRNLAKSVTVK